MSSQAGNKIMSIYLVIDMSESMTWQDEFTGKKKIKTATSIFPIISNELDVDETIKESLRFNIIGFNCNVIPILRNATFKQFQEWQNKELKDLINGKGCEYQTFYGAVFKTLKEYIDIDFGALEKQRGNVSQRDYYYRPLVYFLSDGIPEGEEPKFIDDQYRALVSHTGDKERWNPSIFCIGIGNELSLKRLRKYAAGKVRTTNNQYLTENGAMAFVVRRGANVEDALSDLNHLVLKVIKDSLVTGETTFSSFNSSILMKKIERTLETETFKRNR